MKGDNDPGRESQELRRPASTRRDEPAEEAGEDERPLPPFFAGDDEPADAERPVETGRPAATGEPADQGPGAFPFEEDRGKPGDETAGTGAEAFPFEKGETGTSGEEPAPGGTERAGPEAEAPPAPGTEGTGDDFPVEAFDVPGFEGEDAVAAPAPADRADAPPADTSGVRAVAERLETLAARLRAQGAGALSSQLEGGDRFDALLAGMIAGYLAARDE